MTPDRVRPVAGLEIDDEGGGRFDDDSGRQTSAQGRTRNGERWLTTPPLPPGAAPDGPEVDLRVALLRALVDRASADGAPVVHWESDDPEAAVAAVARKVGLDQRRDILQLRRPLPVEPELKTGLPVLTVRPLRPGTADEAAWVRCNNRSFADHPDQGEETVASLRAALSEPWFEPGGLLLADGDPGVDEGGDLDGFCWTRIHPASSDEVALGEIYVIGIDPAAGGRSLGSRLTLAGLDHLAGEGIAVGMLYVDADNAPARRMYDRLRFSLHHTRRVRSQTLDPLGRHDRAEDPSG